MKENIMKAVNFKFKSQTVAPKQKLWVDARSLKSTTTTVKVVVTEPALSMSAGKAFYEFTPLK